MEGRVEESKKEEGEIFLKPANSSGRTLGFILRKKTSWSQRLIRAAQRLSRQISREHLVRLIIIFLQGWTGMDATGGGCRLVPVPPYFSHRPWMHDGP